MSTDPFYAGSTNDGDDFYAVDVDSRLERVKGFSLRDCDNALKMDNLQKTVRTAVERRQRKLRKTLAGGAND